MLTPSPTYLISAENPSDHDAIEALHAISFGPGRFARAAFRVREQGPHDPALSFAARLAQFHSHLNRERIGKHVRDPAGAGFEAVISDPNESGNALDGTDALIGSVRLTWITTGDGQPNGLLLGPLAVAPTWKNKGAGRALMRQALSAAAKTDAAYVLLVGDAPYYEPFGFAPLAPGRITMPGPVDPKRLLMAALWGDAPAHVHGLVRHAGIVAGDPRPSTGSG